MALHIIIDGYNLIRHSPRLSRAEARDLKSGREALIEALAAYRRLRRHQITLVFDGGKQLNASRGSEERIKGIRIIFSPSGVQADDIIKRLAHENREKALVVTGDRDIAMYANGQRATVVPPPEFEYRLDQALSTAQLGNWPNLEGDPVEADLDLDLPPTSRSRKKGPSKRRPRLARKAGAKLEKL